MCVVYTKGYTCVLQLKKKSIPTFVGCEVDNFSAVSGYFILALYLPDDSTNKVKTRFNLLTKFINNEIY